MPTMKRMTDGRTAPVLMVKFRCPKCGHEFTLNVYDGVPSCLGGAPILMHGRGGSVFPSDNREPPHPAAFCEAIELAEPARAGGQNTQ